jgi:hypothetical protein
MNTHQSKTETTAPDGAGSELTQLLGRFFRKWLQCRLLDTHWSVTHHDDSGIDGAWTCDDCGHYEPAIEWPKPPPMPTVKPARQPCEEVNKGFNYVNITTPECVGWLYLFLGDDAVCLVKCVSIADDIRKITPERGNLNGK